ncbi:MAG: HAD family hydrolase [Phycisphaerales bacterium JB060]
MSIERLEDVRVVCLDWGGVLLRICNGWEEACTAAGLPMPDPPVSDDVRIQRRKLAEAYQLGHLSCEAYFPAVAELSPGYTVGDIERLHDAYLLHEYEGAAELAEDLAGHARLTSALLSNTNARHWTRREEFTAAGVLEHQLASHLYCAAKPDAKFYRALEGAVGASGPQIVFFDDLEENVAAARAMGWQAVRVDPSGDTILQVREALGCVLRA